MSGRLPTALAYPGPAVGRAGPVPLVVRRLRRSRSTVIGGSIIAGIAAVAVLAPILAPRNPMMIDIPHRLLPPGGAYPLGTDQLGRDLLSRIVFGARISLVVGGLVTLASVLAGLATGLLAGYAPRLDRILMRLTDGLMAFPTILLAIALMAALGAQLSNVVIALAIVLTPRVARVIRGVALVIRDLDYIQAARSLGAGDARIVARHILPNCLAPVIVQGTFNFAEAVLAEAALSFLGVGLPPYIPSWGTIITDGRLFIQSAPWITLFPGLAIVLTVLGLNLLGDGLRDLTDPRLRGAD